jgi:hypothetical protein
MRHENTTDEIRLPALAGYFPENKFRRLDAAAGSF